jgi:hypothetical protein
LLGLSRYRVVLHICRLSVSKNTIFGYDLGLYYVHIMNYEVRSALFTHLCHSPSLRFKLKPLLFVDVENKIFVSTRPVQTFGTCGVEQFTGNLHTLVYAASSNFSNISLLDVVFWVPI